MSALTYNFPQRAIIAPGGITPGYVTTITTLTPHGYKSGLIVKIVIPYPYETSIFHNKSYPITILSPTQFTIPQDTTSQSFGLFPISPDQEPQVIPVAEQAITLANAQDVIGPNNPPV